MKKNKNIGVSGSSGGSSRGDAGARGSVSGAGGGGSRGGGGVSAGGSGGSRGGGGGNPPIDKFFERTGKFHELFENGMGLVEEAVTFLDHDGPEIAKKLPPKIKIIYEQEAINLTTRLMQVASWLILQRAVVEGEMSTKQAKKEKENIKNKKIPKKTDPKKLKELPPMLIELINKSTKLQERIQRLDDEIINQKNQQKNPVKEQRNLLKTAFEFSKKKSA